MHADDWGPGLNPPTGGGSHASAAAVESDFDPAALHDHRDRAVTLRVTEHPGQRLAISRHVPVLNGHLPLAVLLTGGGGIGSGVLAEDENRIRHDRLLSHTSTTTRASHPAGVAAMRRSWYVTALTWPTIR